jgi:hypothetical protein
MLSGFAPATACSAASAAAAWSMGRHRTGNLRECPRVLCYLRPPRPSWTLLQDSYVPKVAITAMIIYFFKAQNLATSKCKLSLHCQISGCLLWHEVNLLIRITKHIIQTVQTLSSSLLPLSVQMNLGEIGKGLLPIL